MVELFIILLEIILITYAANKGQVWLQTTSILHIFLVLAINRRLGYVGHHAFNINTIFSISH